MDTGTRQKIATDREHKKVFSREKLSEAFLASFECMFLPQLGQGFSQVRFKTLGLGHEFVGGGGAGTLHLDKPHLDEASGYINQMLSRSVQVLGIGGVSGPDWPSDETRLPIQFSLHERGGLIVSGFLERPACALEIVMAAGKVNGQQL